MFRDVPFTLLTLLAGVLALGRQGLTQKHPPLETEGFLPTQPPPKGRVYRAADAFTLQMIEDSYKADLVMDEELILLPFGLLEGVVYGNPEDKLQKRGRRDTREDLSQKRGRRHTREDLSGQRRPQNSIHNRKRCKTNCGPRN